MEPCLLSNGLPIVSLAGKWFSAYLSLLLIVTASFEVSCSGSYVEAGLRITCTSPVIIASLEYTLNDGSPVIIEPGL